MKQPPPSLMRAQRGAARRQTIIGAAAAVLVVAAAAWLFWPRGEMSGSTGMSTPAVITTEEERGDSARELIAELQRGSPPDYAAAFERGEAFRVDGRLADAQLLYFFAARGGNADAAFVLGEMNDPNHFAAETSLMNEPDAFQAYKYYAQARDGGVSAAGQRLAALREWAEQHAAAGDFDAEQLLVQWE